MKKIVFWGATAQSRILREALPDDMQLIAVFDNNRNITPPFTDVPLYFKKKGFEEWRKGIIPTEKIFFAVAIGGKNGKIRCEIAAFLKSYGLVPYTIIHNSALLAPSVELGEGAQILQGVNLLTGTKVGDYSIVAAATVGHDCIIGKGVHICGGNVIGGCTEFEDYSTIYTGAITAPHLHIGEGAVVGIGSIVLQRVKPYTVVYGNPALKIDDVECE